MQRYLNLSYYMASSVSGQDESNPALWLATRAGKMELSCPLGTIRRVPQEKFPRKPCNKSNIQSSWPHTWSITHRYFRVAVNIHSAVHETIIYMVQIQLSGNLVTDWRYLVKDVAFMVFGGSPHRAVFKHLFCITTLHNGLTRAPFSANQK